MKKQGTLFGQNKKLSLSKDTLRVLSPKELSQIAGRDTTGTMTPQTSGCTAFATTCGC